MQCSEIISVLDLTTYLLNVDFFISRRISAGDNSGRTSPAVKVAIASVALSIAVMILAVSIVGGFRREILQKVTGFNSHITLYPQEYGSGVIKFTPELDSIISGTPGVASHSLSATIPALLKSPDAFRGIYLQGISRSADTTFLHSAITGGRMPRQGSSELLISASVARHLGLSVGDSINLFMIAESITARRLPVSGIYNSHFENYDDYLVFAPIELPQELASLSHDEGTTVEIYTSSLRETDRLTPELAERLNNGILSGRLTQVYRMDTALDKGANYLAWLDMLDTNVWIILTLMTLVAVFTLISGLLIIILQKVRFIGVMKAIGASSGRLRHIFVLMAVRIAVTGLLAGNALALAIIAAQSAWHVIPLNPEAYYIDFVPVSMSLPLLLALNAGFILIIYLMLILPARFVSRISPAESMRFEH